MFGTCGRVDSDSCARVTPYCSVWAVGYDISCGSSDPKSPFCTAYTSRRDFRARRGLRDSGRRVFETNDVACAAPDWPARSEGKNTMTVLTWSDDRVEQLKKLWEAGLSASQIAAELGNVTRNAVIGKVHRLGLSGRAKSPSSAAPRPRKPRQTHMMRMRAQMRGNTALAHAYAYDTDAEPEPEVIENIIPIGQRRTLVELNEATCRWPIGDPSTQ